MMTEQTLTDYMHTLGKQARQASRQLAMATTQQKNQALELIYQALVQAQDSILHQASSMTVSIRRLSGIYMQLRNKMCSF